jgi:alpha-beta hydrolase superfamily lysophospholipase
MSEENTIVKYISFPCDRLVLQGYLHLPPQTRPPVVIGSHGLYSSGNSPKQIALAEECNRLGIAYFRFDHRGCGKSQGEFEEVTSLEARCRDLIAAAAAMRARTDLEDQLGLFGSSMGGTVCLSAAGELGAQALVTFAAPIRSRIPAGSPRFTAQRKDGIYLDAAKTRFDITGRLAANENILVFHGDSDDVVPVSHAEEIYDLAGEPKKKIIQKKGDHLMSNPEHQQTFVRETSMWFKRYLN